MGSLVQLVKSFFCRLNPFQVTSAVIVGMSPTIMPGDRHPSADHTTPGFDLPQLPAPLAANRKCGKFIVNDSGHQASPCHALFFLQSAEGCANFFTSAFAHIMIIIHIFGSSTAKITRKPEESMLLDLDHSSSKSNGPGRPGTGSMLRISAPESSTRIAAGPNLHGDGIEPSSGFRQKALQASPDPLCPMPNRSLIFANDPKHHTSRRKRRDNRYALRPGHGFGSLTFHMWPNGQWAFQSLSVVVFKSNVLHSGQINL
jgi:hypothetical protein